VFAWLNAKEAGRSTCHNSIDNVQE